MRNPHRWRKIALGFFASGIPAVLAAFFLPGPAEDSWVRSALVAYGAMAILFGGGTAIFRHFDARAKEALARGEDVIARWQVEPAGWAHFVAHDRQWPDEPDSLPNELSLSLPATVPADGVEVIVGRVAVQIGESIHRLPRHGTPEITDAILHDDGPGVIELRLYYPGGGHGASGVPHPSRRAALRFPVARGCWREASEVVAHFRGDLGGKPDFFHGKGEGSNPEDLSKCYHCGYETHRYVSHCPKCGSSMQSRRWSRRFGIGLVVCGLFITGIMSLLLFALGPKLLQAGAVSGGMRFSGTPQQARLVLGLFGAVELFGVTALCYGIYQIVTGRRNKWVVYFGVGLILALVLFALVL